MSDFLCYAEPKIGSYIFLFFYSGKVIKVKVASYVYDYSPESTITMIMRGLMVRGNGSVGDGEDVDVIGRE